jgi:putative oxidoreductase
MTSRRLLATSAPAATLLLRIAIAFVFVGEGIRKFIDPDTLGAGRFVKIGIPAPHVLGPFVGGIELVGGVLIALGLVTRLAALALVADMIVAIVATKIPILIGHGFAGFADPGAHTGFWAMAHEARTDVTMLLGCAFLVLAGAGPWSIDASVSRRGG